MKLFEQTQDILCSLVGCVSLEFPDELSAMGRSLCFEASELGSGRLRVGTWVSGSFYKS
jgi:hypothetical protein